MSQQEIDQAAFDRAVRRTRDCTHDRCHYEDENGNRRCVGCEAFIRPVPGARMLKRETRTLTNGFIQPLYGFHERMAGLPVPEPKIEQQQRWTTEWETIA